MSDAKKPALLLGPAGLKLRTVSVSESLGRPYRIELELLGEGPFVPASQVLGLPMAVEVDLGSAPPRHFHGRVSEFQYLGSQARVHVYRVVLRPWLWFLSRAVNCRIFQELSVVDIIKEVFSAYDFADLDPVALEGHKPKEFVVQYRESDLNFVTRLMEEEGIYYFFKHTAERHALVLCNQHTIHEGVPGFEKLPFFPPDGQRRLQVPSVDRWEVSGSVETNAVASKDFDFIKPTDPLLVTRSAPSDHALGTFEVFEYPGEYLTFEEGETRTRLRVEEHRVQAETFFGHSNAKTITVGATLGIEKHKIDTCNGTFLVLSSVFRMAGHALESGDLEFREPSTEFVAVRSDVPFRLSRTTPKPYIMGAQTAVVVTPDGREVEADSFGRVRVKFHWDRRKDVEYEKWSCLVRVSQLWAGAGFGGIHIPRKGQEVIVEFLEGDPDRPIITGRVYNGVNEVPYELPKNVSQSGIKSATIKGEVPNFNELRFDDEKGKEEVFIQAERDKTVKVKRNRSASVGGSDSVSVGGNRTVNVTGNLTVEVGDKGGKYSLDAKKDATLNGKDFIKIKCGDNSYVNITPDGIELKTVNLKINATTVEISGTTLVDVKGALIKLNS